jgi:hypothetical protein
MTNTRALRENKKKRRLLSSSGEYNIVMTAGNFPEEITWSLDGAELGTFAAETVVQLGEGEHLLTIADSYGDGWNGADWTLLHDGEVMAGPFTMSQGASQQEQKFYLGSSTYQVVLQGGAFPESLSWSVDGVGDPYTPIFDEGASAAAYSVPEELTLGTGTHTVTMVEASPRVERPHGAYDRGTWVLLDESGVMVAGPFDFPVGSSNVLTFSTAVGQEGVVHSAPSGGDPPYEYVAQAAPFCTSQGEAGCTGDFLAQGE